MEFYDKKGDVIKLSMKIDTLPTKEKSKRILTGDFMPEQEMIMRINANKNVEPILSHDEKMRLLDILKE